jgi:hypothetical protein
LKDTPVALPRLWAKMGVIQHWSSGSLLKVARHESAVVAASDQHISELGSGLPTGEPSGAIASRK